MARDAAKRISLAMVALLISMAVSGQRSAVLSQKVDITQTDIRFDQLIRMLSRQTSLHFSVNTRKFTVSRRLPVSKGRQTVAQLLDGIEQRTGIGYALVGMHIIFIDRPLHKVAGPLPPAISWHPSVFHSLPPVVPHIDTVISCLQAAPHFLPLTQQHPPLADTAHAALILLFGGKVPLHTPETNTIIPKKKDTKTGCEPGRRPWSVKAPQLFSRIFQSGAERPVTAGAGFYTGDKPTFAISPFVRAGVYADETFYLNPTLHAGLPFLYGIVSWSYRPHNARPFLGAGTSVKVADNWRLHLQATFSNTTQSFPYYDTMHAVHYQHVNSQIMRGAVTADKRIGKRFRFQVGVAVSNMRSNYLSFKPPFVISKNEQSGAGEVIINTWWLGAHAGLYYQLDFFK
ncbi:hypothetical protein [Chitinophaga vietnamensis]|uniref:hypothetical protein n=2 Tax=Chitinophaga vietnamensis TaxID=2593957 RepID=UPI001375A68C|nr:hypothetical protein [Chitinophaga vietnamensis]